MTKAPVTVVVAPHEGFAWTEVSLHSVVRACLPACDLVYVDAGSPPSVRDFLRGAAERHGFRLRRYDHYLAPNDARCRGLAAVETPYVLFVDNDVLLASDCWQHLLDCAETTGAWLVAPLYLQRHRGECIHMAGGELSVDVRPSGRYLIERHHLSAAPLSSAAILHRAPTDLVELHCLLARTDALRRLGGLDPHLICTAEHIDVSLATAAAGGAIYLEPSARVTILGPDPVQWSDLPYFLLRWSDRWAKASLDRLRDKWGLAADDPYLRDHRDWIENRRTLTLPQWRRRLRKLLGEPRSRGLERRAESLIARWTETRSTVLP